MTFRDRRWFRFAVAILATWRVTHLLAQEDGPGDLVVRVRARLGNGFAGELADCFQCLSLWVAAPMAFWVSRKASGWPFIWLAVSGASCLLERIGQEPVLVQTIPQTTEGDSSDGMLWRQTNTSPQSADPRPGAGR
jgi:hypothetical protein